jgi:hypothetical protein
VSGVFYAPGEGLVLVAGTRGVFAPVAPTDGTEGLLERLLEALGESAEETRAAAAALLATAYAWDLTTDGDLWRLDEGAWNPIPFDEAEAVAGEPVGARFPIGDGIAHASGVWLRRSHTPPRQEMPDANLVGRAVGRVSEPAERSDDDTFDLDAILADRSGAVRAEAEVPAAAAHPRVRAVRCPCSAINRPGERHCRRCGLDLEAARIPTIEVSWPVVATIRLDDGSAFELARPLVVGRAPRRRPASDPAVRLTVDSAARSVSGSHLELRPVGWDVHVTDLESANGTYLEAPGATERARLTPGAPIRVEHGSVVWFGDRSLTVRLAHGS